MESSLHPGETRISVGEVLYVQTSREWAAAVIQRVAEYVEHGAFPQDVDPFDLGRALSRALMNCSDTNCWERLANGMIHVSKNYENAFMQTPRHLRPELSRAAGIQREETDGGSDEEE